LQHTLALSKPATSVRATFEGGENTQEKVEMLSYELEWFLHLAIKQKGNVLEALYSPLLQETSPTYEEMRGLIHRTITKYGFKHYLGFAESEWRKVETPLKNKPQQRVKSLL